MKSKKNNYKLKIVDLDLYERIKNNLKNSITDKSKLYQTCMRRIAVQKIMELTLDTMKKYFIKLKKPISSKLKEGGIVCKTNYDSEKEKKEILIKLKKEVMNKPGDIVKDKQGNKIGFIKEVNNNKYFDKDDSRNNYGIVNDLTPIWKRKMKRSDFK